MSFGKPKETGYSLSHILGEKKTSIAAHCNQMDSETKIWNDLRLKWVHISSVWKLHLIIINDDQQAFGI